MRVPVGMIAAAIAVPLVYGTLRKLFPAAERAPGDESLDALKAVHQRTELIGILVFFFVFWPLCGYAWWLVLVELAEYEVAGFGDPVVAVSPGGFYWALAAFFPAGITAVFPAGLLVRFRERARYRQWLRYLELQHGYRQSGKITWFLLVFLAVPAIILALLTLNWHVVLTEDNIHMDPWLSSERVYGYDEVAEIQMDVKRYADSDYVRRVYVFKFRDGFSWPTTPGLVVGRQDRWSEIARVISQRSGVSITETDIPE